MSIMTFLLFALVAVFNLSLFVGAAPRAVDTKIPVRYDGAQLWKIYLDNDESERIVVGLENDFDVSIWSKKGKRIDVFLKKSAVDEVQQVLAENDIAYDVLVEDMQKQIEQENSAPETIKQLQRKNDHPMTWEAYHRLDDIFSYLDYLVEKYPDLCSLETIGYSHEKRPLKVLKISNGNSSNKAIWIDGGIHAREWISPASVTYIVNDFVENWNDQPQYIQNINWYVLPVHNPDGYEYTHETDRMWRKNRLPNPDQPECAGVDLNRNFGYEWGGKGTSDKPCSEVFKGKSAFSEPESTAVKNFLENTKEDFNAFLTYHSYGQYILYPWGYDEILTEDTEDLHNAGEEAAKGIKAIDGQIYEVGSSAILLYPAAGGSDDYGKSIGIKYSYTIELRDTGKHGFILPAEYIQPTAKEAREFAFTISRAIANVH